MNPKTTPSAPLRNRMRAQLAASAADVWSLVGDLTRFPEYSFGLDRVEVTLDDRGACTDYLCRFKPLGPGEEAIVHRELVTWFEQGRGFASQAEEPNAFGLTRATTLVELEPRDGGMLLTWEQYFDADDIPTMRAAFDEALADIGERLVGRFGGTVLERTTDARGQ